MEIKRVNIKVYGIVQGVGFRPFIHAQFIDYSLKGWIRNTSGGAEIEIEGTKERIETFIEELYTKSPKLAMIEKVDVTWCDTLKNYTDFHIEKSMVLDNKEALISPDVCICDDCLRELFDPSDRRYRYPFINCTNCGPRFTIIKDVPYDRPLTTMSTFPMCDTCNKEYTNIENRRYHAQPVCCEDCGPKLSYVDNKGNEIKGDPIKIAQDELKKGKIVAIKGLGGFHLAALIDDEKLAFKLRERKHRDAKPFAIMCYDTNEASKYCLINEDEKRILEDFHRPIVLLKKKDKNTYKHISENDHIGVMLPYTPVHYLLLHDELKSLIMTSANISDTPIIYTNKDALDKLKDIADGFLLNNRDIYVSCDDSVGWVYDKNLYFSRRSRGYVPYPITIEQSDVKVLALGAEQKANFVFAKNNYAFPSAHIGDLKNLETYDHYVNQIKHFEKIFGIKPDVLVCDLHPDYLSSEYARQRSLKDNLPLIEVQHHYAHMVSCMADNKLNEKCIGIIFDGTGFGTDNTIWGGEYLVGDTSDFERLGSIKQMTLVGGDKASKEIWRLAYGIAYENNLELKDKEKMLLITKLYKLNVNLVKASSMGRLFDVVANLLGIKDEVSYEGQGAILLESMAIPNEEVYPYSIDTNDILIFNYLEMLKQIINDVNNGCDKGIIAAKFMNTVVEGSKDIVSEIRKKTGLNKVVLSGGSFQNQYMLDRMIKKLKEVNFEVYHHIRVSTNDEGLALGQCVIARNRYRKKD